jgi:Ferric uptake regulator family
VVNDEDHQGFECIKELIYSAGVATDPADLLRRRGVQITAQRLAVLRAVAGQPHITADAVADVVRSEIGTISLQSVYDALGFLVAEASSGAFSPPGHRLASRTGSATTVTI